MPFEKKLLHKRTLKYTLRPEVPSLSLLLSSSSLSLSSSLSPSSLSLLSSQMPPSVASLRALFFNSVLHNCTYFHKKNVAASWVSEASVRTQPARERTMVSIKAISRYTTAKKGFFLFKNNSWHGSIQLFLNFLFTIGDLGRIVVSSIDGLAAIRPY